jgi:hypothetical protein
VPEIKSTRLRYVATKEKEQLSVLIDALPFKIEIKQILKEHNGWVCWFVIPDIVSKFNNIDFRDI